MSLQLRFVVFFSVGILALSVLTSAVSAQSPTGEKAGGKKEVPYSKKGADTCLKCHDEDNEYPVLPIFYTKHGEPNDARSPMASLQCETCHGPGGAHQKKTKKGEKKAPIRAFGPKAWTPPAEQNATCLQCHSDHSRVNWDGSPHESVSMVCTECHVIHTRRDPMTLVKSQTQKCQACHLKQKAEFQRTSTHPVRFDKMRCTQCHNPHGAFSDNLVKTGTKNELCYTCHAEKRPPKLWEHAPVVEDCTLCHFPHGSSHQALLKKTPPLLCQACHASAGHPSVAYTGDGLPSGTANQFLLAKSCLNCHSQVHGSNHPSGVKLMR